MILESDPTEMLDVAIIGAGLCGLQLATLLQPSGRRCAVFEARPRVGGRILTLSDGAIDLGPTWFWPRNQPRMTQLVATLGLACFAQHDDGRALFLDASTEVPRTVPAADLHGGAQRLDGGMARLTAALAERLPAGTVRLKHRLQALVQKRDHIEMHLQCGADTTALRARQVVLALPPRLVDETIRFTPELPAPLSAALRETLTWMASTAKAAMQYPVAFWREAGHSGNAFIGHPQAVLCEVFDACNPLNGRAALAGFFDLDPAQRQGLSIHLPRLVRGQFAQLFGPAAADGIVYHYDWAEDPLTCSALDRAEAVTLHPLYGDARLAEPQWGGRLLFGGSESAGRSGGYLEGALEAAARIAAVLAPQAPPTTGAGGARHVEADPPQATTGH